MRRQFVIGGLTGLAVIAGIGGIILGTQQGLFSGKDKRLLTIANQAAAQGDMDQAQSYLEELITTFPDSPWADDALLKLGEVYHQQNRLGDSQNAYRLLMERFADSPLVDEAQGRLGQVNITLLFSPVATEADVIYEVKPGDTLVEIAQSHKTTVELVKRANELSNDVIRPKQRLKVPKGQFQIVVDKSQRQLLLTKDGDFVKTYPIGVGREDSTPEGTFKIVNRIPNPVWYKQGAVVPPDAPENILGTRWMGLDKAGYGIHGTDESGPISTQQTAGCVRMVNSDVEELFTIVPIGTEVTIVN